MKNKYWVGHMSSICGYGIIVVGRTEAETKKLLKKEFYGMRKGFKIGNYEEFYTFKNALDYFGGGVNEFEIGENLTFSINV